MAFEIIRILLCLHNHPAYTVKILLLCIAFPVAVIHVEPEIIDLEENQIISEIALNFNNSVASRGNTFVIDIPQISMKNGPFRLVHVINEVKLHVCAHSHLYIIVIVNNSAINATVLSTRQILYRAVCN